MTKSLQTQDLGAICGAFGFSLAAAAFRGYEISQHRRTAWSLFLTSGRFVDMSGRFYTAPLRLSRPPVTITEPVT